MPVTDDLGNRMKSRYEDITRYHLVGRMPTIIRIDGTAFHTFTKGFESPFDNLLSDAMISTTIELCENIQGCVFGYTQSDEISLLIVDYKNLNSTAWFDNNIQKMVSASASMATLYFNKFFSEYVERAIGNGLLSDDRIRVYRKAIERDAMFDSRVFNVPKEDVTNYFYWRQLDATKNAVTQVARHYFSDKELFKKGTANKKEMLKNLKGVDFDKDFQNRYQMGASICKRPVWNESKRGYVDKFGLCVQTPKFSGEGREFVERTFMFDSEG